MWVECGLGRCGSEMEMRKTALNPRRPPTRTQPASACVALIEADIFFESTAVCLRRVGTCGCFQKKYQPQWELIRAPQAPAGKCNGPRVPSSAP